MSTESYGRSYSTDVPVFLRNRPTSFIKHCMSKLELADLITAEEVMQDSDSTYRVRRFPRVWHKLVGHELFWEYYIM